MNENAYRTTILTIVTGFLFLYFLFSWRWAFYVSLMLGIIGIASPFIAKKIHWVWIKFSEILGYIVPKILLSITYYSILVPTSFLYKIFNKDPLMLSDKYGSFFINVNKNYDKKSFEDTW